MSLTNMGGPRARKLIKVTFTNGATSDKWYVWARNPDDDTYDWRLQNNAAFEFGGHAIGTLILPSGWTTADIGLKVCATATGTFGPFKINGTDGYIDGDNKSKAVVEQAAASESYAMPPFWIGAGPFCVLHSMTASQAGDQSQTAKDVIMWLVA